VSTPNHPPEFSKRDLLVGLLAVTGAQLHIPCALDAAAKATEPLFQMVPPNERWFPLISPVHARQAIFHATRLLRDGYFSKEECDWICAKARLAIINGGNDGPQAA
jgi:hypothetical protein